MTTQQIISAIGQIVGILAGAGVLGGGTWRLTSASMRKARAAERRDEKLGELLAELVDGHRTHDAHHALLEANQWRTQAQPATTSTPWVPSQTAAMRARQGATSQP